MKREIIYYSHLYLSDDITSKELAKIQNRLSKCPMKSEVYLITPAANPKDMVEFFEGKYLTQRHYRDKSVFVIGISKTYGGALKLVERLIQDCLKSRGDCSLREYLSC